MIDLNAPIDFTTPLAPENLDGLSETQLLEMLRQAMAAEAEAKQVAKDAWATFNAAELRGRCANSNKDTVHWRLMAKLAPPAPVAEP